MKRRSSIYHGRPPFSLFGVGPYTFAPYKVAISGMHKSAKFRALGPVRGRPVVLDDTCYFLPCSSAAEAAILTALCNDPITLGLIASISFRESKRPVTKKLLQRLDFGAILKRTDDDALYSRAKDVMNAELCECATDDVEQFFGALTNQFHNPK